MPGEQGAKAKISPECAKDIDREDRPSYVPARSSARLAQLVEQLTFNQ